MVRKRPPIRTMLAGMLLVSTCSSLLGTSRAHAALGACRSDPIVVLSDGNTVQLYTDIYDLPASVTSVAYVLHARAGTTVLSISYPSDMTTAIPETFQLIPDGKDAKYKITAYVSGANNHSRIVTYAVATLPKGTASRTVQQNGHVNQLVNQDLDPSQSH